MKKVLIFAALLFCFGTVSAQFEGVCEPSFVEFLKSHNSIENFTGKTVGYLDFSGGNYAKGGFQIETGQALKLVSTLVSGAGDPRLSKQKKNWVITPEGLITISYTKGEWRLAFLVFKKDIDIVTLHGARVFTLS